MTPILLAIDPGKSGGFALQWPDGKKFLYAMPKEDTNVAYLTKSFEQSGTEIVCAIEKVGGYVGEKQPGSRAFVFGYNTGFLRGCLLTLNIPLRVVTPQAWQKFVGAGNSKAHENKAAWKRHLLELAKQRHPGVAGLTLKTCDALLILDWLKGQGV